jgi:hypothetical protein
MQEHEFAAVADRVRKVINSLSPSGGLHNIRIRNPDPRKHSLRVTVENANGVSMNDLASALAPARIFIRSNHEVGSMMDIYYPYNSRRNLMGLEAATWAAAIACFACFLCIVM